jgi:hypothetical protein
VLNVIDDAALLWRMELDRTPIARLHAAKGGSGGVVRTASPSAPVAPRYLAFLQALRMSDAPTDAPAADVAAAQAGGSDGVAAKPAVAPAGTGAAASADGPAGSKPASSSDFQGASAWPVDGPQPLWLPAGASVPTRWTELARHTRPYAGQHVAVFNDAQIAMALVAAGDEEGLQGHLRSMQAYADGLAAPPTPAATAPTSQPQPQPQAFSDIRALWVSQLQAAPFLLPPHSTDASAGFSTPTASLDAAAAGPPPAARDNMIATALLGLDLAHGMVHFWRSLQAQNRLRDADLLHDQQRHAASQAAANSSSAGAAAGSGSRAESSGSSFFSFLGFGGGAGKRSTARPTAAEGELSGGEPASSTSDAAGAAALPASERAALELTARSEAQAALRRLLQSRPHWNLLGGSLAQRDVFEQTLLHAAVGAGELPLAAALASERCTVRFGDASAWYLLGSVLELAGQRDRAADAKNRAYALGMGSRSG